MMGVKGARGTPVDVAHLQHRRVKLALTRQIGIELTVKTAVAIIAKDAIGALAWMMLVLLALYYKSLRMRHVSII